MFFINKELYDYYCYIHTKAGTNWD